jgi:hypothetical protein
VRRWGVALWGAWWLRAYLAFGLGQPWRGRPIPGLDRRLAANSPGGSTASRRAVGNGAGTASSFSFGRMDRPRDVARTGSRPQGSVSVQAET